MKAFNLRLAKQGHPVCTRDGHNARIVCWDYNSVVNDNRPIIALISEGENEVAVVRGLDGKVSQNEESNLDLMMDMDGWELGYKDAVAETCKWLKKEFKAWNRISVEAIIDKYYNEIMEE